MGQLSIQTILNECPSLSATYEKFKDVKIKDYIRQILPENFRANTVEANLFLSTLEDRLLNYYDQKDVKNCLNDFKKSNLLQTADSCQLILDSELLWNNGIFSEWAKAHSLSHLITQQCSTVKLLMYRNPVYGPGFIKNLTGDSVNLFDLSNKKLQKFSVMSSQKVKFDKVALNNYPHFEVFLDKEYESAANAIIDFNKEVWNTKIYEGVKTHFIHEELTIELFKNYLSEGNSDISKLVEKPQRIIELNALIGRHIDTAKALFLRNTTDIFYIFKKGEMKPLKLKQKGGNYILVDENQSVEIPFKKEELIKMLEARELMPNLFFSMLVLSHWPGVRLFGGASQHEYHREISNILGEFYDTQPLSDMSPLIPIFSDHLKLFSDYNRDILNGQQDLINSYIEKHFNSSLSDLLGDGSYLSYIENLIQRRNSNAVAVS